MYFQSLNSKDVGWVGGGSTTTITYNNFGVPSTSWTKYTLTFTSNATAAANGIRFFIFRDAAGGYNKTRYSQIQVEAALKSQDEDHAAKLSKLIESIDEDHTNKLQKVVEAYQQQEQQKQLVEHENFIKKLETYE